MRIYLDPGHGGKDPGAIGYDPWILVEEDVAWSVALGVRVLLEGAGHEVRTSRPQSRYVTLGGRTGEANAWPADAFVSIHCNAAEATTARGVEVLHYGSRAGSLLAQALLEEVRGAVPVVDRGLKIRPDLAVLRLTQMPAALVELPFISTPAELEMLAAAGAQAAWSRAIARGVLDWGSVRVPIDAGLL